MKILTVYTSYPESLNDWKGRFIYDFIQSLSEHKDVSLSCWGPSGPVPDNVSYLATQEDISWFRSLMRHGGIAHLLRTNKFLAIIYAIRLTFKLRRVYLKADSDTVFHINWLQNALALGNTRNPALITVLGSDYKLLNLPFMKTILRRMLRNRSCVLCPNADWMAPRLEEYFGDLASVIPVPFGIHDQWFQISRSIEQEPKRVWLVVLRVTNKKIGDLFHWGKNIFTGNDELHLFGPNQEGLTIPDWVHYHGSADPDTLKEWYSSSYGLITLSQHDEGRPQVILEAMASGLPVIASSIPPHADLIKNAINGLLVSSEHEFREAISKLSDTGYNNELGSSARAWVTEKIGTWRDCSQRYISLYNKLSVSE